MRKKSNCMYICWFAGRSPLRNKFVHSLNLIAGTFGVDLNCCCCCSTSVVVVQSADNRNLGSVGENSMWAGHTAGVVNDRYKYRQCIGTKISVSAATTDTNRYHWCIGIGRCIGNSIPVVSTDTDSSKYRYRPLPPILTEASVSANASAILYRWYRPIPPSIGIGRYHRYLTDTTDASAILYRYR